MPRRDNKVSMRALAGALSASLLLSGCLTMPNERAEPGALPEAWRDAPQVVDETGADRLVNWWTGFDDPTLDALIAEGVATAPSVQIAALRVRAARALSYASFTRNLPNVNAVATGNYSRAVEGPLLPNSSGGFDEEQGTASWGAQASWEVPLFSLPATAAGIAGNNRAALADQRGALVSIAADIAQAYVDLRAAQRSQEALTEAVANADRIAGILDISAAAGFAAEADAADARRQAEAQRARLASFGVQIRQAESRLAVLRGHAPGTEAEAVSQALAAVEDVPSLPISAAPAAPADLIRLRPDVAAAEAQTLIAAAQVGVARADLLPRLNLTGSITVTDNVLGTPLGPGFTRVAGTPLISMPLFDWGQRIAVARQRRAEFDSALIQYRQTVNGAVAEATNALAALDYGARSLTAARRAEEAAIITLQGRRAAYEAGLLSLADLLFAEQQAIDARLTRINSEASQAGAGIAVYRAFGGGPPMALPREDRPQDSAS